jgi:hypothetical protein
VSGRLVAQSGALARTSRAMYPARADSITTTGPTSTTRSNIGDNVQIATSNQGGALLALKPAVAGAQGDAGKWTISRAVSARVLREIGQRPHRQTRALAGRAGVSGPVGRTATPGTMRAEGTTSKAVHFQLRPNPLAK